MCKEKGVFSLFPKYARFPLLFMVVFNCAAYILPSRLFVTDVARYDLTMVLDQMLPCVPFFVLFYVLAYAQWLGGYVLHCRDSVQLCYRLVMTNVITKAICLVCYVLIPTTIQRPEITGSGLFAWGTRVVYAIDDPVNLLPSIHCLESWIAFRGAMMLKKKNGWYIAGQGIMTLLVFASVVLIKQHFIIDIPISILVCELALFLAGRCGLWRVFNKIQTPSAKAWLKENAG
jgi:hypothetical protein